jgi:hypothetical protein
VDEDDICAHSKNGQLLEFPIYSENRWLGAFLTPERIYRVCVSRLHRFKVSKDGAPAMPGASANPRPWVRRATPRLILLHAWKADFNQCTGRQLIGALRRAEQDHGGAKLELPFVLIGHSKLFTRFNQWSLRPFLAYVARHPERFGFGRFGDFDLESLHAGLFGAKHTRRTVSEAAPVIRGCLKQAQRSCAHSARKHGTK